MTKRTLFIALLSGFLILAAIGGWFLYILFSTAYRIPGHIPAMVYAVEMTHITETLRDLARSEQISVSETTIRRLKDAYIERATALSPLLDPILANRLSEYHQKIWPAMDRWLADGSIADTERFRIRSDLDSLRKIVILAGQRIEYDALEERRAVLLTTVRVLASILVLLFAAAGASLIGWYRASSRRTTAPEETPRPETMVTETPDEETLRELIRDQVLIKRYRTILDSLPAAIVAADSASGQVLFVNSAFSSWFGTGNDIIGEPVSAVTARIGFPLPEPGKISWGDKTFWRDTVEVDETTIYLIRDVSEQERLANRLITSERLISIGEMASKVTHEIRNPLSTVKMNAEYLADHIADLNAQELADALSRIVREVARLEEITERYMGMIRYRAEEEPTAGTELPSALEDIVRFHAGEFSRRSITLEIGHLPAITLLISLSSFREVMLNLIKNAWEELGSGGIVRIYAEKNDDRTVHIAVEDSGRGVPQPERERIFRNFYTTKPGGTGIGLSHSLKLVTEAGGTITVGDSPLGGARFIVTLPAVSQNDHG